MIVKLIKFSVFCLFAISTTQAMNDHFFKLSNGIIIARPNNKNRFKYEYIFSFFNNDIALAEENIRKLRQQDDFDPNTIDDNQDTFLLLAIAKSGDFMSKEFKESNNEQVIAARNIITLLTYSGLGTELRFSGSHSGQTPLHRAAAQNLTPVVRQLLDAKAPVHIIDQIGRTPLHSATANACFEIVQMLIEALERDDMVIAVLCHKDQYDRSVITCAKLNKLYRQQILEYLTNIILTHKNKELKQLTEEIINAQQE